MKQIKQFVGIIAILSLFSFSVPKHISPPVLVSQYVEFNYNIDGGYHNLLDAQLNFDQPLRVEYYVTIHYKQDGVDHLEMFYIDAGQTEYNILDEVPISDVYSDAYLYAYGPVFQPL